MSDRYGIWNVTRGYWCGVDLVDDCPGQTLDAATKGSERLNAVCAPDVYEVRSYEPPVAEPKQSNDEWMSWSEVISVMKPGDAIQYDDAGKYRIVKPVPANIVPGPTLKPADIRQATIINADALAMALHASDPDVEAFVNTRYENPDRFDAVARIAFDHDERGWATRSRIRAARIIDRMSK